MITTIEFKRGYKYQLHRTYTHIIPIEVNEIINNSEFLKVSPLKEMPGKAMLIMKKGYAWDGPSGPTWDTSNFMRGSLVHDALYQLMREGHIPGSYRELADKELHRICREDGMSRIRAWYVYRAVRRGAGFAADPSRRRPLLFAPDPKERRT